MCKIIHEHDGVLKVKNAPEEMRILLKITHLDQVIKLVDVPRLETCSINMVVQDEYQLAKDVAILTKGGLDDVLRHKEERFARRRLVLFYQTSGESRGVCESPGTRPQAGSVESEIADLRD